MRVKHQPQLIEQMRIVKLDEWGGLAMTDPASCEQYLLRTRIEPLELQARYVSLDGMTDDSEAEFMRVAKILEEIGPIDLSVLDLGLNGHIGFNEPAEFLHPHVHVATLSPTSLNHSMASQARRKPTHGVTLGIADILHSRQILLLPSGRTKRESMQQLLSGRVTTKFPASLLIAHPNTKLRCDEDSFTF